MHLWPSVRIRASFKHAHLGHLDWNLRRMRLHQRQEAATAAAKAEGCDGGNQLEVCEPLLCSKDPGGRPRCLAVDLLRDTLLVLSCCCCCFCCGACLDDEEK